MLAAVLAAAAAWQWTMTQLEARRFPAPGRLVDIGGRRLHLLCSGAGAPTVILEPSGLGSVIQYDRVREALALDLRVCAYDRAGQGWSDPSPEVADARHLAADLSALLARSGEAPPYLFVASSAGGLTVELFAREHPKQVAGLVMVDALSGQVVRSLPQLQRLESIACRARVASWFGLPRMFDPLGLRRLPPAERDRAIAITYRTGTLATACSLTRAFAQSAKQIAAAPPLPADHWVIVLIHNDPAGIIPGVDAAELADFEQDWQLAQSEFAHQIPNGDAFIVHSRHLIASERPEVVIGMIRRRLDKYRAAGSP